MSPMIRRSYQLELIFDGPLLTHAVGSMAFGVDAAMQTWRGCPVINGSLIKGNIRHALEYFSDLLEKSDAHTPITREDVKCWFGEAGIEDHEGEGKRSRVDFDFHWKARDPGAVGDHARYRIQIESDTGSVARGSLMAAQVPYTTGDQPAFIGAIQGLFDNEKDAEKFEDWLRKALDYISAIGAQKGVGLGRIARWELKPPSSGPRYGIRITLDRPFCIARPILPGGNRYVSEAFIPGNVLKGAIANSIPDWKDLLDLDEKGKDLIITHAQPASPLAPERKIPLPLSLAACNGEIFDLALFDQPGLIQQPKGTALAPVFQPDWKGCDWAEAERCFRPGGATPPRWLSVRTRIEAGSNVAQEGELFSFECIDPSDHVWCADLDLPSDPGPDPEALRQQLQGLFRQSVDGIGKTKARAKIEVLEHPFFEPPKADQLKPVHGEYYLVLLCSKARLLPPKLDLRPTNGEQELRKAYAQYWDDASDGALTLNHYFAQQELFGGYLYAKRFLSNAPESDKVEYRPEWLTLPGSVFVLTPQSGKAEQAQEELAKWLRRGLPPAADRKEWDWRCDPFRPDNGFGEILVNHPRQIELLLEKDRYETL